MKFASHVLNYADLEHSQRYLLQTNCQNYTRPAMGKVVPKMGFMCLP